MLINHRKGGKLMPARYKKSNPTARDLRKRLNERARYAKNKGDIVTYNQIQSALKKAGRLKTEKGQSGAYSRALEKFSAKTIKTKKKESEEKRRKTFRKRYGKNKEFASDIISKYNKLFGNEYVYEAAQTIATEFNIGKEKTNHALDLLKSTRSRYNDDEKMQFLKAYLDYVRNRKEWRELRGVTSDKEFLKYFSDELKKKKQRRK